MAPEDLAALAMRARDGDARARRELLVELYAAVRKHMYLVVRDPALAEDAVQETMIAIHRGLPAFRGDSNPRSWALTIATRTAYRLRRKEARYVVRDDVPELEIFDTDQQGAGELAMLRRLLGALAPKKRDAFVLMAIFELSADEAARALGTFANTAASRFRHARADLEAALSRKVDEAAVFPRTKQVGHA